MNVVFSVAVGNFYRGRGFDSTPKVYISGVSLATGDVFKSLKLKINRNIKIL